MRLIDADALLAKYSDILDCEIDHPKYQDTIREIIESAPTVPQWIPVSEGLPERGGWYLVSAGGDAWATTWVASWDKEVWMSATGLPIILDGITAWAPLPEPFREDTER